MAKVENVKLHGLNAVRLTDSSGATCEIMLDGAHVTSWKSADGIENLFVSSKSEFGNGKAVRGGIPLCWPQFNTLGPYGKHGFARNSAEWTIVRTSTEPFPSVVFGLTDSEATRKVFPFAFSLRYAVTIDGAQSMSTSLTVMNTGDAPMEFTTALHTYFSCATAAAVNVQGLLDVEYLAGETKGTQTDALLNMKGEIDRIYYNSPSELYLTDVSTNASQSALATKVAPTTLVLMDGRIYTHHPLLHTAN